MFFISDEIGILNISQKNNFSANKKIVRKMFHVKI